MIETGVLFDHDNRVLHWHRPVGATVVSLPDSQDLWDVMWKHRRNLGGFAHSHPGSGIPSPSHEDVTTFSAIERALGRKLLWYITSSDCVALYTYHAGADKYDYRGGQVTHEPSWVPQLRFHSKYPIKEIANDDSTYNHNR